MTIYTEESGIFRNKDKILEDVFRKNSMEEFSGDSAHLIEAEYPNRSKRIYGNQRNIQELEEESEIEFGKFHKDICPENAKKSKT